MYWRCNHDRSPYRERFDVAHLLHLEGVFKCCLDLPDLFAGLGGDEHVVDVEAHIDVVVIVALDVYNLICPTPSKSNLREYHIVCLAPCTRSLLETTNCLIQLTRHLLGVC